jgi:hypothetical protein
MGKGYTLGGFYRMNNYAGFGFLFENNSLKNNRLEWKLIGQQIHSLEPIREAEKKAYYSYRIRSLESGLGRKIDLHHKISFSLGVFNEAYLYQTGDHIIFLLRDGKITFSWAMFMGSRSTTTIRFIL